MLTIEFPEYPKARAIIIDKPFNGVSGIVECANCEWRAVLVEIDAEGIAQEIETFIKKHNCQIPTMVPLLSEVKKHLRYRGGR